MLAIVVVVVAVVAVWRARTPGAEVNIADVVAVALAGAMLAGSVLAWALRSTPPAIPAIDAASHALASLVERQWRTEILHRLLDDPKPIPVHWQLIADKTVMSQPDLITAAPRLTFTGRSDDIAALANSFRALTRRRLIIVGGAGMGKTTLAIQLLLRLLATRTADQTAAGEGAIVPVPVLLPVSGWDTSVHPRLHDWLAVRLVQDYPALAAPQLGVGAAAALADGGHILPVLDGLDEIPAAARAKAIAALNASLTARDQIILTSRRAEFTTAIREAGRPLTAAAIIVPKPVTPQAAADYLAACLPASPTNAWTQTLAALRSRTAPGLTWVAATPLGLWLIRTVYVAPRADPAPLTGPLGADADALRAHLLDRLIPALIQARPPSTDPADHFRPRHQLDPETTRSHLTYLARAFPPAATRDIAWWHIASTTPRIQATVERVFRLVGRVVGGVVGAVLGGLTIGVVFGAVMGAVFGFGFGLILEEGGGFLFAKFWVRETPGYANLRLRGRTLLLLRSIKDKFWIGLVGGLAVALVIGPDFRIAPVLGIEIVLGAVLGITLASGLTGWAEQPTLTSTSTPRSSWQGDRALNLLRMVVFGLVGGLAGGLVGGLLHGAVFALVGEPAGGIVSTVLVTGGLGVGAGVGLGLVLGNHHAWLVCTIAVSRLALEHRLPWRVMDFLDDAHRLGLLRAVGPVYQFRHAALQDHLTRHKEFNTQT
jgi:hypothetical protein